MVKMFDGENKVLSRKIDAVLDRGCGSVLIVFILTCAGWVPGVIAALVILNKNE